MALSVDNDGNSSLSIKITIHHCLVHCIVARRRSSESAPKHAGKDSHSYTTGLLVQTKSHFPLTMSGLRLDFQLQISVIEVGKSERYPAISWRVGWRQSIAGMAPKYRYRSTAHSSTGRQSVNSLANSDDGQTIIRVILDSGGARVAAHLWWEVCVGTNTFYASTHLNCAADESSAAV